MKAAVLCSLLVAAPRAVLGENPLGKVVQLLDELVAKITADGDAEGKAYHEYTEWCAGASHNAAFAVKDATDQKARLEAKISELSSAGMVADTAIGELAAAISTAETDIKSAEAIRTKEAEDFAAGEKELVDGVDTLGRAINALQKEASKNSAALTQIDVSQVDKALLAISVVLDAASFASSDKQRLASLLQAQEEAADDDAEPGAPAAAGYKSHGAGIVEVLEDMKEKAESQLGDVRKAETTAVHNYQLLRSSLETQKKADEKDMKAQQAIKAEAEEAKAGAEGDLEVTTKSLADSQEELATTRSTCMTVAADHEATHVARAEELEVLGKAKQILTESSADSFVQVGMHMQTRGDLARSEVVDAVRKLARKHHSSALAQLASRIAAIAKYGSANGADPFAKVTDMIREMIARLEKEASEEATEKAYCDEEMAKTEAKKGELEDTSAGLTTKIDQDSANSARLKEEVSVLESELAALTKEQAEMDKIRMESHTDYVTAKKDLEQGLVGVRNALRLLRDYYAAKDEGASASFEQQPPVPEKHSKATGAGQGIIGILEVVESDFATNLAKEEQTEADAQSSYDKVSQENHITKTAKEQDITYKVQESKSLDGNVAELSSDREGTNGELEAVLEYYAKIKERCIATPQSFEERSARRAAEIDGLKQALATLNEETAFVQRRQRNQRRHMRGGALAA